jgi:sulfopyruvate decarboxylase TPP-binding subunit
MRLSESILENKLDFVALASLYGSPKAIPLKLIVKHKEWVCYTINSQVPLLMIMARLYSQAPLRRNSGASDKMAVPQLPPLLFLVEELGPKTVAWGCRLRLLWRLSLKLKS